MGIDSTPRTLELTPQEVIPDAPTLRARPWAMNDILQTPRPVESLLDWPLEEPWGGDIFLPAGIVGLVVGEGGCGKSRLACSMALSVAWGIPWLAHGTAKPFSVARPGSALIVSWEDDLDGVHRRLHKAAKATGAESGEARLFTITREDWSGDQGLTREDGLPSTLAHAIVEAAPEGCQLVIIDPLARFRSPGVSENDNVHATFLIDTLEWMRRKIAERCRQPTTLLAVHHTSKASKSGADAARGASALRDGARWMVVLNHVAEETKGRRTVPGVNLIAMAVVKSNETRRHRSYLVNDNGLLRQARPHERQQTFGDSAHEPGKNDALAATKRLIS